MVVEKISETKRELEDSGEFRVMLIEDAVKCAWTSIPHHLVILSTGMS